MKPDLPFQRFLEEQSRAGLALARANPDLLHLIPDAGNPPTSFIACFRCPGMAFAGGAVRELNEWIIYLRFPDDFLGSVNPLGLCRIVSPTDGVSAFHPNIGPVAQNFCLGHVPPASQLVFLLRQAYDILTWHRVQPADCLNREAAAWAVANRDRWPLPRRELLSPREEGGGQL